MSATTNPFDYLTVPAVETSAGSSGRSKMQSVRTGRKRAPDEARIEFLTTAPVKADAMRKAATLGVKLGPVIERWLLEWLAGEQVRQDQVAYGSGTSVAREIILAGLRQELAAIGNLLRDAENLGSRPGSALGAEACKYLLSQCKERLGNLQSRL
jgi:hypothetical protein